MSKLTATFVHVLTVRGGVPLRAGRRVKMSAHVRDMSLGCSQAARRVTWWLYVHGTAAGRGFRTRCPTTTVGAVGGRKKEMSRIVGWTRRRQRVPVQRRSVLSTRPPKFVSSSPRSVPKTRPDTGLVLALLLLRAQLFAQLPLRVVLACTGHVSYFRSPNPPNLWYASLHACTAELWSTGVNCRCH